MTCIGQNRTLQRDFLGIGPKQIWSPETTYFQRLHNSMATLRANISSKEHDIDNRKTALETTEGQVLYIVPKYHELMVH